MFTILLMENHASRECPMFVAKERTRRTMGKKMLSMCKNIEYHVTDQSSFVST